MNKEYVDYLIKIFDKYNIAPSTDRSNLRKVLNNLSTNCNGLSKELGFAPNYLSKEFNRKLPKEWSDKKGKTKRWISFMLFEEFKCPVCGNKKKDLKNTTCGYSCSNTYFRTGINNGNFLGNNYRTICFSHHKKECIVCKESILVEVHHFDENKDNNRPENLIPLCPTHHQYWHSKNKHLVYDIVITYRKEYIKNEL